VNRSLFDLDGTLIAVELARDDNGRITGAARGQLVMNLFFARPEREP
jgi:hypothetical protein